MEQYKNRIPGGEKTLLFLIFFIAFLLRFIYILQISHTPYFANPIGDSNIYYQRAKEILQGDFMGNEVFFHSSPPYPYFMAFILLISQYSFFFLYLIQIIIGSGNCLLIYFLTKKLTEGKIYPAFLAGLLSAFYGLFAFFDGDLLMIFLTLFSINLSLLLLLKYKETHRLLYSFLAGISLAMGILDKPNLLLFAPLAIFFLYSEFSFSFTKRNWKPVILFLLALFILIFPVTLRNYVVGKDFVLISSNGGVNFYIGNNPISEGVFKLPPNSGLRDPGLYESSVATAEKSLNRKLKPSEASKYWFKTSLELMKSHPLETVKLYIRKFLLLFNYYEIPNHLNYYFVKQNIAPVLNWMPVGFWLITPLALLGIAWKIKNRLNLPGKLYLSFLIIYMLSLLPFFITERYRLPMVPLFIVFASTAIFDFIELLKKKDIKIYLFWSIGILLSILLVSLPFKTFSFSFNRMIVSSKYLENALKSPHSGQKDIKEAIIGLKWALETSPNLAYAHYNLGLAYEAVGFYSGSIKEFESTLQFDPGNKSAASALEKNKKFYEIDKDKISKESLPKTPYEIARDLENKNQIENAIILYRDILLKDPKHFESYNRLGLIYYHKEDYAKALRYFKKGLDILPYHYELLKNTAETYQKLGNQEKAKLYYDKAEKLNSNMNNPIETE